MVCVVLAERREPPGAVPEGSRPTAKNPNSGESGYVVS